MYIIVTGACGFIGANLVKGLNRRGIDRIIAVDNLSRADKFKNLVNCEVVDYLDKQEFLDLVEDGYFDGSVEAILHQGACSDTMEGDGRYMMMNNYRYSSTLLDFCLDQEIPFLYASSASVYGSGKRFEEIRLCEAPLNVYGYSKFLFDQRVRQRLQDAVSPVVGLRYFNVYGPCEQHKQRMASVAFHLYHQFRTDGRVKLFEGCDGYSDGEQCRDFVYIDDVVKVNLHFLDQRCSGIFNLGTGRAEPFNAVAHAIVNACRVAAGDAPLSLVEQKRQGLIEYVAFPEALKGKYQSFTQADLSNLRAAGYRGEFATVEQGIGQYVKHLLNI